MGAGAISYIDRSRARHVQGRRISLFRQTMPFPNRGVNFVINFFTCLMS